MKWKLALYSRPASNCKTITVAVGPLKAGGFCEGNNMETEETKPSESILTSSQKFKSFQSTIIEEEVRGYRDHTILFTYLVIFQDNRKPEEADDDNETETNNQKTFAYLCKILDDVFDSNDKEEDDFYHHQEDSVSQAQDHHLIQEYDIDPDQDVKGDRFDYFFFRIISISTFIANFFSDFSG